MEVSENGGTQNTQKWSFLVGKPMVVGEIHHFRKPLDSLAFDDTFTHSETKAKMQQHLPCRFCLQLIGSIWAILKKLVV